MELKDLEKKLDPIDVPLMFDAEGNPTDGFKVVGANSEQYQEADRAWKLANVRKSARRGRGIEASTETGARELVDLIAKREAAICAACIVEIYGFTIDGQLAPLHDETLKAIFSRRPTWRAKVVAAVESEQVFTQG
jgi:hypothetical protein